MDMAVKLLMTWDILPGKEQEYFEFVVRELVPGMQRLGIQPTEAWLTTFGERPQILTGGVTDDLKSMRGALATDEWRTLRERLSEFVSNFQLRVVRATGGLADSVVDYDPKSGQGYGFTFKNFVPEGLLTAVVRAIETHKNMPLWQKIVKRAMSADFSWKKSAEKYLDLYRRALQVRKESLQPNPSPASRPLYS